MGLPGEWSKVKDQDTVSYENCCEHHYKKFFKRSMTWCLQGEIDSFGAEYWYYCDQCAEEEKKRQQEYRKEHGDDEEECDWCGRMTPFKHIRNHRDFEEGFAGRVYHVCNICRENEFRDLIAQEE